MQVGAGWVRKPVKKKRDSSLDAGAEQSLYAEESLEWKTKYQAVIRFLWSGDTLLHEWEVGEGGKRKLREREGEKADYLLKMEENADQKARTEAEKGTEPPNNLITWVFQADFIPRAKLTEEGAYSIISDYLGTPVEAYDGEGMKVWERELDIYGRIKRGQKDALGKTTELVGEDGFIPFRYQGQYEDVETGLYYNRFRYYSPSDGCYTQVDPIGLAGGNPTIYGYVGDTNWWLDPFGLERMPGWMPTKQGYQRHHLIPDSVWKKSAFLESSGLNANGATNMTYLPVADGIDVANTNSSLHKGYNSIHGKYNLAITENMKQLEDLAKMNNWDQNKIQEEIRKLQSNMKNKLKSGEIKCH